jgi:hypothetical protein
MANTTVTAASGNSLNAHDGTKFVGRPKADDTLVFDDAFDPSSWSIALQNLANLKGTVTNGSQAWDIRQIEYLQFSNGVYDVAQEIFVPDGPPPVLPTLSIGDAEAPETFTQFGYANNPYNGGTTSNAFGGFRPVQFKVTLSEGSTQAVSVSYSTQGIGSAVPGEDFIETNGTVTFAPGDTEAFITVYVADDFDPEADETFSVTLSSPTNAAIADGQAIGTIENDDEAPPPASPTLSIGDAEAPETFTQFGYANNPYNGGTTSNAFGGFRPVTFTVTLSEAATQPVTVSYSTQGIPGSAIPGQDFIETNGTLTFAVGQTQAQITVFVADDFAAEPDETFSVVLSSPTNAAISDGEATGIILNDDTGLPPPPPPQATVSLTSPGAQLVPTPWDATQMQQVLEVAEGGTLTYTFTRTATPGQPLPELVVNFQVATNTGSATPGVDFELVGGQEHVAFDYLVDASGGTPGSFTDPYFGWYDGTVTFAEGQTQATVVFSVIQDGESEGIPIDPTEHLSFNLMPGVSYIPNAPTYNTIATEISDFG